MKKHFAIIFNLLLVCVYTQAQVNCDITTSGNLSICGPGTITLSVQGNTQDVQWTNSEGRIISTSNTLTTTVNESSTFHVINKIPFGLELIRNGDFENGNTDFTSKYNTSCIQGTMPQGAYCITDNSGWFHPGWSNCQTRESTGEMMVSDGAITANEAIWCQSVAVEQNKDYAFSAWLTTLIGAAPPIMQFSINGKLLGEAFESNDTPCDWQEFFEIWNSGTSTSADICIVNQNTAGNGNDFALDNISLRETCFDEESINVIIIDSIKVDLGRDTSFCAGDEKLISNLASNQIPSLTYEWSTGETTPEITITNPTQYVLKVETAEGCFGADTVIYTDTGFPVNTLGPDTNICFIAYPEAILKTGDAISTTWTHNFNSDTSRNYKIYEPGKYNLVLSNGENCTIRHELIVEDECSKNLFIPNAFTPNNDGVNDFFGPESVETYSYDFTVYNRWGEVVFHSEDVHNQWNGNFKNKPSPSGVYAYKLEYSIVGFYSNLLQKLTKSGVFTLIR